MSSIIKRLRDVESQIRALAEECRSEHLMNDLATRPVQFIEAGLRIGNIKIFAESIEDSLAGRTEHGAFAEVAGFPVLVVPEKPVISEEMYAAMESLGVHSGEWLALSEQQKLERLSRVFEIDSPCVTQGAFAS